MLCCKNQVKLQNKWLCDSQSGIIYLGAFLFVLSQSAASACIQVEVFLCGVNISVGLRSITSWECVHRKLKDVATLIPLSPLPHLSTAPFTTLIHLFCHCKTCNTLSIKTFILFLTFILQIGKRIESTPQLLHFDEPPCLWCCAVRTVSLSHW